MILLAPPACSTDDGGDEYSDDDAFVSTDVSQDRTRPDPDTIVADVDAGGDTSLDFSSTDPGGFDGDLLDVSEPPVVGLTIVYDYRYDVNGVLSSDAARFTLEEAARQWGYVLHDDFDEIAPGTAIYVRNPQDTSEEMNLTLDTAIDDLLVFVGGAPRSGSAAGSSATATIPAESDDPELSAALRERWDGDDFEPWTGWIQYNTDRDWFFDETPETGDDIPSGTTDALSTTLHELGHILGIAPGGAYGRLIEDEHFVGARAMEVYGGPVPLADSWGHIAEDVTIDGVTPIMATGRIRGQRYAVTRLDIAMLADIGYEVTGLD